MLLGDGINGTESEHKLLVVDFIFYACRYQIFVVEQSGNFTFNKGRVMNSGFNFVKNQYGVKFDCYIFHDVDMLPEYDKNIYR